jgi:moderate conductance mechanosensitive channel
MVIPTLFRSALRGLLLLAMLLGTWLDHAVWAQTPAAPATPEVSPAQIEDVIRLLEDEHARTAFLQRLRALVQLQAKGLPREPVSSTSGLVSRIVTGADLVIQHLLATSRKILAWTTQAPQHVQALWASLTQPQTWRLVLHTLLHLVLSLLAGGLAFLGLRWLLRPLARFSLLPRAWPIWQRLWQALLQVLAGVLPLLGLILVTLIFLRVLDAAHLLQETVRYLLTVALVYHLLTQVARAVLAPERPEVRLLPLRDEDASYLWVWFRRFLLYGLAYSLIISMLALLVAEPRTYQGVRALLLCVFPALVTIFVAQVVRQRARAVPAPALAGGDKVLQTTQRVLHLLWPFLLVVYAWALTGFVIAHHAGGVAYLLWGSVQTALAALGLFLALRLFNWLFRWAFRISDGLRQRYPFLEVKVNRYLTILQYICHALLVLLVVGIIFAIWGIPVTWVFTSPVGTQFLARLLIIALAIALASVVIGISKTSTDFLLQATIDAQGVVHEPERKRRTLVPLVHAVMQVGVMFVAALVVLEQLGVNIAPILAGVGILGLAVGFGAQSLVKDVINGLFILFEDSLSVGDVAVLRGTGGSVEKITLRAVTLRDLSGSVHVIPNSSIDMVTNLTKEYSHYVLDIGVAYREDADAVMAILREVDTEMRNDPLFGKDMLEPIEIMGLDRFADSAQVVRARLKTRPIQQWRIGREFNRRLKKAFDAAGIEMPFPHRTLYWGLPKQGTQPPVHVAMEEQTPLAKEG